MEGQVELLDYLESLEKQGFNILDYIGTGRENARTREQLCVCTGIQDRAEEQLLLKHYVQQEESRLKSIGWSLKAARKTLMNCGIDWRDYGKSKQG